MDHLWRWVLIGFSVLILGIMFLGLWLIGRGRDDDDPDDQGGNDF